MGFPNQHEGKAHVDTILGGRKVIDDSDDDEPMSVFRVICQR